MSEAFNADEVLRMAEEIEKSAGTFYREVAQKAHYPDMKTMFLNMASMEDGHLRIFEAMRKDLKAAEKESMVFDPYNEAALYLQGAGRQQGK